MSSSSYISLKKISLNFPLINNNKNSLKKFLLSKFIKNNKKNLEEDLRYYSALKDISLNIENGDRVGLIGGNGAGKTSLLRLMNQIYYPSSGFFDIKGDTVSLIDLYSGIDFEASGYENLILKGLLIGHSMSEIKRLSTEIIKKSELENFIHNPIRSFSTGMIMKLLFYILLSKRANIVLMDEWLSVGDENFKKKAQFELENFLNNSDILVIASHSRELIENYTNKIIWLDKGRLVKYGPTKSIVNDYFQ